MNMKPKDVILAMLMILTTQLAIAQKTRRVSFTTFESDSLNSNRITFCIEVPRKYDRIKMHSDIHSGLQNKVIYYSDLSIIYIGNNIHEGSILNFQNRLNAGYASFSKGSDLDTLTMNGSQSNGNVWREDIVGHVVIGYINVPANRKLEYDKALSTLRRKK